MTGNTNEDLDFDDYVFWDTGMFSKVKPCKNGIHISGDRGCHMDKCIKGDELR